MPPRCVPPPRQSDEKVKGGEQVAEKALTGGRTWLRVVMHRTLTQHGD